MTVEQEGIRTHGADGPPVAQWFEAHDRYHKASARYNERLLLVRAERERGNWTMKLDEEYADLTAAQSAALAADNELYDALKAAR